jgi:hypothetical protein
MSNTISTEPLARMLRSIALQKRTGLLRVEQLGDGGKELGEFYFERGRLLQARAGQEMGQAALKCISSWKHITCSFDGMSRPRPGNIPVQVNPIDLVDPLQRQEERGMLVRMLPPRVSQTGDLARSSLPLSRQEEMRQRLPAGEPLTYPPNPQPADPTTSANLKASMPAGSMTQPFVLRGNTLETYVPARTPRALRSNQRWTTHTNTQAQVPARPETLPVTPHVHTTPADDAPREHQIIFRARRTTSSGEPVQLAERRERIIFMMLNGKRTIQEIARLIHYSEAEVERILIQLTKRGYTEQVQEQQTGPDVHEKMANLFTQNNKGIVR